MLLLTFTVQAQDDSDWVYGKVIVDVEFKGLKNVDKSELNGVVTPYIGKEFSSEIYDELEILIYELDYFDIIIPSAIPGDDNKETVVIVFQVEEAPSISKIKFEGNSSIWNTELFSNILLKSKDIYSEYKVEKAKATILDLYINKGYDAVTVEVEKELNTEENSVELTFYISEGVQTLIRGINFNGNNLFATDSKLRSLIDTRKKTLFNDGVYKEDVIQSDRLKIQDLYHNNGYVKAKVLDVKTTIEDDPDNPEIKNLILDFFIEEGDVYSYGGISYVGNEVYTAADFDAYERLKFGEIYNKALHDRRFNEIKSLYYDNGYIGNSFHDQIDIDEENKIISHTITVLEKGVAHIGSISVTGNEKTKDIVILREIQIESGDVFSRQKVWDSLSNIMSTALFTNAIPELNTNEDGDMDLVFNVEEARTLNLMGGITVSGEDFEPALTFSIKDTNFMGMGRTFGGSLNLGLDTQSFSLEYREPRIFNTEYFGGGSISYTHSSFNYLEYGGYDEEAEEDYPVLDGYSGYEEFEKYEKYEKWLEDGNQVSEDEEELHFNDISLSLSGGHLWYTEAGRLRASAGYSSSMDAYFYDENVTPFKEEYRERDPGNWEFSDRVWSRAVLDARDTPIGTTQGYGFSQSLTYGGVLPFEHESDYIKSVSNADFYFKLLQRPVTEDWDLILSLRLHAAYTRVFAKPGMELAEADKSASLDGMFVGRGWLRESDGEALLDLKVEINAPLIPGMLGASLFFDAANIWNGEEDPANLDIDDFKFSFGGSIGITNQIMPISFFLAKTFYTEDDGANIVWSPEDAYNKVFGGNLTWGISFNLNYLLN